MKQKLAFSREKITRERKTALISLYSKVKKKYKRNLKLLRITFIFGILVIT